MRTNHYLFRISFAKWPGLQKRLILKAKPGVLRLIVPSWKALLKQGTIFLAWGGLFIGMFILLIQLFQDPYHEFALIAMLAWLIGIFISGIALRIQVWNFLTDYPKASCRVKVVEVRKARMGLIVLFTTVDIIEKQALGALGVRENEWLFVSGSQRKIEEAFSLAGQPLPSKI